MLTQITKAEFITGVINDVKINAPNIRQKAKPVYFLLNYGGTFMGLMSKQGFNEDKSKFLEKAHKELYKDYYSYIKKELKQAKTKGFVTLAFGLRLRTPIIKEGVNSNNPMYKVEAEMRSAGNALFQSYSSLTLRAFSSFMRRVWISEYSSEIHPVVTIYDSIYLDIPNDLECLKWVNDNLIECMEDISGCPELEHPIVKLGAELEVYYPSWANAASLPNSITEEEIYQILNKD